MVNLFQKVAEYEAEPHFNARPSGLATALQNHEALLRDFGRSQYFRKGESVALRHPAPEGRTMLHFVQMMLPSANDVVLRTNEVAPRRAQIKEKIRLADFYIFIKFRP